MSKAVRIEPDLQFIKDLQAAGGESLKKCYQCATCSVACPLSPMDNPYPRKEMIWAQWGLKDKLVNDLDIWLCHNCGTCSELCPRGAKPADLLAGLRNMAYRNLVPGPVGKWMSSAAYLPILIGIPAILYLIIWFLRATGALNLQLFGNDFTFKGTWIPEGPIVYGNLFPGDFTIDPIFGAVFLFVVFTFYNGITKMIKTFEAQSYTYILGRKEKPGLIQCLIDVIKDEVLTHKKFVDCGADESKVQRKSGHLALFYAFICLGILTSIVAVGHWGGLVIGHQLHTPIPLYNPIKWLGLIGILLMGYGLLSLTNRRLNQDEKKFSSSFYDWYLLGVIWAVWATGTLAMVLRLADVAVLAYPVYYMHLISVFMLFAYLPWSKLGHLVYRTVALAYAKRVGRLPMN